MPEQRRGGEKRDPAVVVKRADHPGHPQAQLSAGGQRHRQSRSGAEPQSGGQPGADFSLAAAAQPVTGDEWGRLKQRVVSGVGDHVDRLPQRKGIGGLDFVTGAAACTPAIARIRPTSDAGRAELSW